MGGAGALPFIQGELEVLFTLMEDDRDRYLAECHFQADGLPAYVIHFLGIDSERKPWTIELIRCGLAIGNIAYMWYKEQFRRVRPSTICPGLVPPFGPPRHPSFPSGHSFLGHFIALLLLDLPGVAAFYGEDPGPLLPPDDPARPRGLRPRAGRQVTLNEVRSNLPFGGPLLWLANRLGVNRERIGVHYPSDTAASRWLAGSIWGGLTYREAGIECPALHAVMRQAAAEWVRS
jgi:membrane-associated phospholipid phosphatase